MPKQKFQQADGDTQQLPPEASDAVGLVAHSWIRWHSERINKGATPQLPLEAADAIARAAHLWIRSLCQRIDAEQGTRQAIASGLIAGLCERLDLDPRVTDLVAYVYALLDDQGSQALSISRMMLDRPVPAQQRVAYHKGKMEAAAIVEMLAYHRNGKS